MNEGMGLDFETGLVMRDDVVLMTVEELSWLVRSAVAYVKMFPDQEYGKEFVDELREDLGMGFTAEQFKQIQEAMKKEMLIGGEPQPDDAIY